MALEGKVVDLIVEKLGVNKDQVIPEAWLGKDLGATSHDIGELVKAIEHTFGTFISDKDAAEFRKVGNIIAYLKVQEWKESRSIETQRLAEEEAQLQAKWAEYYKKLVGQNPNWFSCPSGWELWDEIGVMELQLQWRDAFRELYTTPYPSMNSFFDEYAREESHMVEHLHSSNHWSIIGEILQALEDFPARKPLIPKWHERHEFLYGKDGFLSVKKGAKEIQKELDEWATAVALEEQWHSDAAIEIHGTIVGSEWRKDDIGLDCQGFRIALDNGASGFLALAAVDKTVRGNVRREYQRRAGHALRSFDAAYPLYDGKRVRARIAKIADWRRHGTMPLFELADGVVEGYEGKGMAGVSRSPGTPENGAGTGQARPADGDGNETPAAGTNFRAGDVLAGRVKNTMPYGAFVDIGNGATGLIHLKQAGVGYVRDVAAAFPEGEAVKVEVIGVFMEGNSQKVSLRLLEFQEKAPVAPGEGTGKPTLLLDGAGLWKTPAGGRGEELAWLHTACKKGGFPTVLVLDEDTAAEMERAGGAGGELLDMLREKRPSELFVCPKGADSVAAAMRRRACLAECRIVGNDPALGEAVGLRPCGVVADGSGVSVPELGLHAGLEGPGSRGGGSAGTGSETASAPRMLVDGMWCVRAFGVEGLAGVLAVLKAAGWVPFAVFDDSMESETMGEREPGLKGYVEKLRLAGEGCVVPSGSKAEEYLLLMADRCGWGIVSNNRFEGMEEKYPWLSREEREGRRVHTVAVIDGKVVIPTLDICEAMPGGT